MPTMIGINLRHAADLIEQRGHARRTYHDEKTGALCAVGAIRTAIAGTARVWTTTSPSVLDEYQRTLFVMRAWLRSNGFGFEVAPWNDLVLTSDVIAGLRRAAASYESDPETYETGYRS